MFRTCWYMFCRFVWNSILLKLKKYVAKYVLVLSTVSPSKYLTIYWGCRRYSGVLFMLAEKVINSKNVSNWWRRNVVYWISVTLHMLLEYCTINFVFSLFRGNCFVLKRFILPERLPGNSGAVVSTTDFCNFSLINLEVPVITSFSVQFF